jgi:aminoglycoside phosphotransferase (APT) family kinase protein
VRARSVDHPATTTLVDLGTRLLREAKATPTRQTLVHGDWHLGQLARMPDGLRLLDVDDLGLGDPAWDLSRPAGFWAAGVLDDAAWGAFLAAYRAAGGPAVPEHGDPWPRLDLPARCAVFVAAVRAVTVQSAHSEHPADALLDACSRM